MVKETYTILLVDNDDMSLKSLNSFLVSEGYTVNSYSDPYAALESFKNCTYEFVLTDYSMPEMSGAKLIEQIKKIDPNISTILYTGYATPLIDQHGTLKQVNHFIKKPLRIRKLIQILNTSLNNSNKEEK